MIPEDLEIIKKRIITSTEKKYYQLYGNSINFDFINDIKKINEKPIKIPYNDIHFLGNKFELTINNDEISQGLAFIALTTGILEKNSLGFGFCKAL